MFQFKSDTPVILVAYLLTILSGVGLSLTQFRWQMLDQTYLFKVVPLALLLIAMATTVAYQRRVSLAASHMWLSTIVVGIVGCFVVSLFGWRTVNAVFDDPPTQRCTAPIVDRRADTGRRKVLSIKFGPCPEFPKGVSMRVEEAFYDRAGVNGSVVQLRYHHGALGTKWASADDLELVVGR